MYGGSTTGGPHRTYALKNFCFRHADPVSGEQRSKESTMREEEKVKEPDEDLLQPFIHRITKRSGKPAGKFSLLVTYQ
ncbi:hypothetical protein JCM10550A_02240 [Methanogenium cariaci]